MKNILILSILLLAGTISFSQSNQFNITFDHQAIMVSNLEASANFYHEILGLKEIDNKTGKPHIRWFSLGDGKSIHLITGDNSKVALNKTIHLAVKTPNFDAFVKKLQANNVEYWDWAGEKGKVAIRNDGAKQVYIQDPDGYWIEINNDI